MTRHVAFPLVIAAFTLAGETECSLRADDEPPDGDLTRGQFCHRLWKRIQRLPIRPFKRQSANDADKDGILDGDDSTPFTPGPPVTLRIAAPAPKHDGPPVPWSAPTAAPAERIASCPVS